MTVEAALTIAAIVAVVVLCVGALVTVTAHIRCVDAAREGARLSALGDPDAVVAARRVAPRDAEVVVTRDGEWVTVRVEAASPLPGVEVAAEAVAVVEPEADPR
ncbi:pilus biosynthesis protein TadE [Rhodococcus kroppenstedtii]|uniref:TadE family type IV pilus minor pilin n=1 Tax=Rhodococcoides kroppenstedtii TaxID=293050 RepID=UPI001C9AC42A|nr:TadE family type IV pilus minor pilin [Rhodococcus kroppenstedtii]MBY6436398.1 pilus biosynthesis protein TadE [Rhodococcus kroppenstedtii]